MATGANPYELGDVSVRALVRGDADLLRLLRLEALAESPDAYVETLVDAHSCDWVARADRLSPSEPADRAAYFAFVDDRPVGMIVAGYGIPNESPFLAAMWVHPDFRRRRAGRALVLRALAFLRAAGQQRVALWVTETHVGVFKFYQSLGFQVTGVRAPLRPGSETTILELALELADSPQAHT
jgi:ribosomal protein S18 acetylase RimI-like enzyme